MGAAFRDTAGQAKKRDEATIRRWVRLLKARDDSARIVV
jgi:hypothetical protein